jgi:hypothetical protein
MNIALYISGRTKLYDKWLIKQLQNNTEHKIDIFGYFNEEVNIDFVSLINPISVGWEKYYLPEKWKSVSYTHESVRPQNMCSMYYNNKKAFELIEEHMKNNNIKYDLIVKFRPDIMNDKFPIFFITEDNEVCTPGEHVFGWPGINDMIAFGNFESMKVYSSMYDYIDEYIDNGVLFHPETMLRHHLDNKGITIKNFKYKYELDKERLI